MKLILPIEVTELSGEQVIVAGIPGAIKAFYRDSGETFSRPF